MSNSCNKTTMKGEVAEGDTPGYAGNTCIAVTNICGEPQ